MIIKGIIDEDFIQYKKPSMFISSPTCTFKCCVECGQNICQNSSLAKALSVDADDDALIKRYLNNKITKAIVFGGLEPMDSFEELEKFIKKLRHIYNCFDDVVIYTGYNADEIIDKVMHLVKYGNIIIKFGRFIPGQEPHFDDVLGVNLASNNQYAKRI